MNLKSDTMTGAMTEIITETAVLYRCSGSFIYCPGRYSVTDSGKRRRLCLINAVINFLKPCSRRLLIHKGAGQIGAVAIEYTSAVNEDNVSGLQPAVSGLTVGQ